MAVNLIAKETANNNIAALELDLASLESVRNFVSTFSGLRQAKTRKMFLSVFAILRAQSYPKPVLPPVIITVFLAELKFIIFSPFIRNSLFNSLKEHVYKLVDGVNILYYKPFITLGKIKAATGSTYS
jgi:hypothetical protein